jgi:MFS family permease
MSIHVALLIVLLNMTAFRASRVAITLFAVELGVPQLFIGTLVAMYSVFPMLLGVYAGKFTDRLGVRAPLIGGTAGVGVGLLVPYLFPGIAALYVSASLIGASWVFYNVCVQNLIGMLSEPESRARNFSNFGLVMAGGSFFGSLLSGFSIDHFGHARTYLHLALIPLVSAVALAMTRVIPPGFGKGTGAEEHAAYSANLLSNKPLRRTLITSAIVLTGTDLFQFYMPIYGRSIGLSASAIGMILGVFAVAAFVVRLVMPRMIQRFSSDTVLVWAMFIGGAAYLIFPLFQHALLLAAVTFVLGLGLGCSQPVSLMLIYDRAPPGRSGEALGLRLTINNFMHITIPLFFGALGTLFGGAAPVFLANAAIMTAGGLLSRKAAPAVP